MISQNSKHDTTDRCAWSVSLSFSYNLSTFVALQVARKVASCNVALRSIFEGDFVHQLRKKKYRVMGSSFNVCTLKGSEGSNYLVGC